MATVYKPLVDNLNEGFEEPADPVTTHIGVGGLALQKSSNLDDVVTVTRDSLDNLVFTDAVVGARTLSQLLSYTEFLLNNDPTAETGTPDCTYVPTYSGFSVTKEEWKRSDSTLIKSIDYTYSGIQVTQEVRKVFAANGTTILAQITWSYSYTGVTLTGATMTRNV